jgi:hypothetical protein
VRADEGGSSEAQSIQPVLSRARSYSAILERSNTLKC